MGMTKKREKAADCFINQETAPDWREIAYEVANILDDVIMFVESSIDEENTPAYNFIKKKSIQIGKYFTKERHIVIQVDEFRKQKDQERKMFSQMNKSLK